jgi:hypothetical protein
VGVKVRGVKTGKKVVCVINTILIGLLNYFIVIYLDNILIYS